MFRFAYIRPHIPTNADTRRQMATGLFLVGVSLSCFREQSISKVIHN
ncbi:hypothetical protein PRABACTJOHN_02165 [Parabacteroides johnsonii DSM 18315]|uniref:Uncharacterized protein n=1 Tax=Parabacteroides johnsonii DSM 18315 TaxID=537006 RepID=B7BAV5_9BACT|nr:hypothetical protein PRABACTJOHN_02165 [Parabacteroides johnsonii DSM 18315]